MNNYSNFCRDIKKDLLAFLNESLFKNIKSLPDKKLILDLVYGVLKSGSIHLTNIVRALNEKNKPNSTLRRFSDALKSKEFTKYKHSFYEYNLNELCINPLKIIIDESDISKPYGQNFEYMDYIHDGSKEGRPKEKGYLVSSCIGIGYKNSIVPLILNIYSTLEKEFKSITNKTIMMVDEIKKIKHHNITFIFDRGYDNSILMNHLIKQNINYVIRAKNSRKYGSLTINELTKQYKGKYSNNYVNKENKHVFVKFGTIIVHHPSINRYFYLVYEKNNKEKEYRVYITNKDCSKKEDAEEIIKSYRLRWRIEEFFRFIKGEYGFEDFRVRTLKAINNLSFILSIAVSYLTYVYSCNSHIYNNCIKCYINFRNEKSEKEIENKYGYYGIKLYQIKRGLQDILKHIKEKPSLPRSKKKKEYYEQLKLF